MSGRNTFVRSMHDLGLAAWFGGSLMGAVGLNGAAATAKSSPERLGIASRGWAKWAPVQVAAIAIHGIGGLGLIAGNKARLAGQGEARANTTIKIIVTALAGASTLASALAGKKMSDHADEGAAGVTEPGAGSSAELADAQRIQRILQWTTPVLASILIVLAAQQGEQQRPLKGLLTTKLKNLRH